MLPHALAIAAHYHVRKHGHLLLRLRVFEQQHGLVEIEVELVLIEHVKRDEIVAFKTQVLKRFLKTLSLIVKVGDDHDDAAARKYFSEPVLLLEDAETQEQMPVLPDVVMSGYRERMRQHVEDMRRCAAANHVDYEMLTTKQPLDFALFSFLSRRAGK